MHQTTALDVAVGGRRETGRRARAKRHAADVAVVRPVERKRSVTLEADVRTSLESNTGQRRNDLAGLRADLNRSSRRSSLTESDVEAGNRAAGREEYRHDRVGTLTSSVRTAPPREVTRTNSVARRADVASGVAVEVVEIHDLTVVGRVLSFRRVRSIRLRGEHGRRNDLLAVRVEHVGGTGNEVRREIRRVYKQRDVTSARDTVREDLTGCRATAGAVSVGNEDHCRVRLLSVRLQVQRHLDLVTNIRDVDRLVDLNVVRRNEAFVARHRRVRRDRRTLRDSLDRDVRRRRNRHRYQLRERRGGKVRVGGRRGRYRDHCRTRRHRRHHTSGRHRGHTRRRSAVRDRRGRGTSGLRRRSGELRGLTERQRQRGRLDVQRRDALRQRGHGDRSGAGQRRRGKARARTRHVDRDRGRTRSNCRHDTRRGVHRRNGHIRRRVHAGKRDRGVRTSDARSYRDRLPNGDLRRRRRNGKSGNCSSRSGHRDRCRSHLAGRRGSGDRGVTRGNCRHAAGRAGDRCRDYSSRTRYAGSERRLVGRRATRNLDRKVDRLAHVHQGGRRRDRERDRRVRCYRHRNVVTASTQRQGAKA